MLVKTLDPKEPNEHLTFTNMRVTDRYEKSSSEMLKVADMIGALQKKPQAHYEYDAALEYLTKGGADMYK